MKALEEIKDGKKVLQTLEEGKLFFYEDIRRASGLDEKRLRQTVSGLLKNGFLRKTERGQYALATE